MANTLRGEQIKTARLSARVVREILRARSAGATYDELSERYGISRTQAFRIVHRQCWRHVSPN